MKPNSTKLEMLFGICENLAICVVVTTGILAYGAYCSMKEIVVREREKK